MTDFVVIEKDSKDMKVLLEAFQAYHRTGFVRYGEQISSWEEICQTMNRLGLTDKIMGPG